jgi:peptidyl-prolyl cis-trans isomerase D
MAVLQKIRGWGVILLIMIALPLLLFVIDPSQVLDALNILSAKNDVGNINGKPISYMDFEQEVERFSMISEVITGSTTRDEQQQEEIRNAAWQSFVDKYLFMKNARDAGIHVGDKELQDLLTGDMISPIISGNAAFADETGNFSKEALLMFVRSIPQDGSGRLREYWNYLQKTVYTQQMYSKYNALFTQSNIQNPLMQKRSIEENNNTSNVDFVVVPHTYLPDSTIQVSNAEIKKYYDDHKEMFRQNASRDIEYVVFEVKPSESDIMAANEAMSAVYEEFGSTDNMKSFLARNSERSADTYWYKSGELSTINTDINDFVFGNSSGVSPIYSSNNVFYAVRVVDVKQIPDSAYVKHILLQGATADARADSLLGVLAKGENFSNLAAAYSVDTQSAADGELGNIGWMTQTYMIPGFESVLTAQTGKPFVLKTQYGTHVVQVSKKTAPIEKKQVAILQKTAVASGETFNSFYAQANRFATLASGSYENYRNAVDSMAVYSHPMNNVLESTSSYGAIDQAKEVTRWVFDNKEGKVSNIITVNQNFFFIVALKDIHKEGIAELREVQEPIRQQLYAEKYSVRKAEEVAEKIKGINDLQTIADTLNATISTGVDVRFASMGSQGLDPKFIGAASVAPEGKICGPIAGTIGTYVLKVNSRDTGAFYTEDDARYTAMQMNSYASQMILPVMMQEAEVKDNRARFY